MCSRRFLALMTVAGLTLAGLAVAVPFALQKQQPVSLGPAVVWTFEQPQSGAFVSAPTLDADHIYLSAIRDNALAPSGVVYCLDRKNGALLWQFDDDGKMRQSISSPCLSDDRIYVGEGMHGNDVCHLYCLDATSGHKRWQFETGGHIESSPCIAGDAVYFGSGDDGLYCLDAVSGKKRWQFAGPWHIDVSPVVVDGRVYAGSGVSVLHRTTEIFCLDAASGQPLWRTPTKLPVWGSPIVDGGQVFFGTGNGRLTHSVEPPEKPAGALVCADAATGRLCWTFRVPDAVFGCSAVDGEHVFFGARDGRCYCLDRREGRRLWQADLGSPIVTRPIVDEGRIVVLASGGQIACLDAGSGQTVWTFDLAGHTQTRPQLLSSPRIVRGDAEKGERLIYFGSELKNGIRSMAILYCLRD